MAKKSVAGTINDPTLKFSTLTLDGTEYKLCFSFNAIALAEANAGTNLLRGLESLTDMTALQLRGLFYAGMTVAHPDVTIEDAGALIRIDTIGPITMALGEAYSLSMPKSEEKKSDPEKPVE